MKFLCDENLPASLALKLRDAGLDAVDVREQGLAGSTDDQVLDLARKEDRIVVTMDVRRFGNLLATPPASTPGLVVVRMLELPVGAVCRRVIEFLLHADPEKVERSLTILEPSSVRHRR